MGPGFLSSDLHSEQMVLVLLVQFQAVPVEPGLGEMLPEEL